MNIIFQLNIRKQKLDNGLFNFGKYAFSKIKLPKLSDLFHCPVFFQEMKLSVLTHTKPSLCQAEGRGMQSNSNFNA